MLILQYIILGLIQGLTEFIPVSSSGHLVIAQYFFSGAADHYFLEFIDIGTTIALIVYFRKKIVQIVRDVFIKRRYRLAVNIIITTIPAGLVGLAFSHVIETASFFNSLVTVTVALGVVGFVMIILDKLPQASPVKDGERLSPWRALAIGIAQIASLIPGVSRSGSTIITGRLAGLAPEEAAEYSFLVSIPIMVAVCLKSVVSDHDYLTQHLLTLTVSNAAAFLSGLFAVGFLMRYLSKHSLAVFGWYRLGLAALLAVILVTVSLKS